MADKQGWKIVQQADERWMVMVDHSVVGVFGSEQDAQVSCYMARASLVKDSDFEGRRANG